MSTPTSNLPSAAPSSLPPSSSPSAAPSGLPSIRPTTARRTLPPTAPSEPSASPTLTPCDALPAGLVPDPPILAAATFTSTAAEVEVVFDSDTDTAGIPAGEIFPCSDVLEMTGVEAMTCDWSDARTLFALVSSALDFAPGSAVSPKAGVLSAACDDAVAGRCDCYAPAAASSTTAAAPEPPLAPVAVIQGPTSAAVCSGFTLSSDQSTGSGGRAFQYAWGAKARARNGSDLTFSGREFRRFWRCRGGIISRIRD